MKVNIDGHKKNSVNNENNKKNSNNHIFKNYTGNGLINSLNVIQENKSSSSSGRSSIRSYNSGSKSLEKKTK